MPTDMTPDIVVRRASALPDPLAALRAALVEAGQALAAQGAAPAHVTAMTWTAPRPAAIHPSQTIVDLSLRESYGGFRPPIAVRAGDQAGVQVEVRARKPAPPSAVPVWRHFTIGELAREYSPRTRVPDMQAIFDAWRADGAAFRAQHLVAELTFGPTASGTIDLYLPTAARGPLPLWIFIHGGYWQAADKSQHGQFAAGMLAAGYAVAMLNYTLVPEVTLTDIVRQTRAAVTFLAREASALGCDANELHISGHSAGGHLAAMIAASPEGRLIRSCLPLSGVFDVAPLACLPMGPLLGLHSATDVAVLSPLHLRPLPHVRVGVAVGGGESGEFQRQSTDFARAWNNAACRIVAGKHHFDLLDGLNGGELLEFAKQIAAGDPRR